jgi:hypothetical protein
MTDNLTKAKQYLTPGAFVPIDMETTTLLLEALRQALADTDTAYRPYGLSQDSDQLPDTTKMIEPVCVRYWLQETMESGRWVTTDPMSKSKAKMLLSETYRNAFPQGEIVELPEMPVDRGAWDGVEDATKWVDELRGDEPDLLNQTCCGCGLSKGYALYCGWCWSKSDKPVDDVNTSDERVPNPDKQGHK